MPPASPASPPRILLAIDAASPLAGITWAAVEVLTHGPGVDPATATVAVIDRVEDGEGLAATLTAAGLRVVLVGGDPATAAGWLCVGRPAEPLAVRHLVLALADQVRLAATNQGQLDELGSRQKLLQAIIDHAPLAVALTDAGGRVRLINRGCERALGIDRGRALGQELIGLLPEILRETARVRLAGVLTHGEISENEREMADPLDPEHPRRYLLTTFPVTIEGGERGLGAIAVDISQRKELEEQLRGAQRMEAIGRLAGGIAHDFNNLLTAILGYGELLRLHLPRGDERLLGYATEISRSGQRAANLTRQLLAFSRRQVLTPQVVDLNHVVREMERLLARLIGEDIALELRLDPEAGTVRVDPSQIEQVVMNLVVNARDALRTNGFRPLLPARVVIATARVRADEMLLRPHRHQGTHLEPGPYVCLAVTDNGPGMDAATRRHIFEPFFTTKTDRPEQAGGKGTGLGLSTVYGIIQQSGGCIEVDSGPGRGAAFRILLPLAGDRVTPRQASGIVERSPGGSETVLLVEDQDDVRTLLEKVLCDAGYTVLGAENPDVALDLARQYGGRIDVMVTDIVMPGINGRELRNQVLAISPGMKVIFMSGYPDRDLGPGLSGRHPFLQKPFASDLLLRTVRQVLEG